MTNDEIERQRMMAGLARQASAETDAYFIGWALDAYAQDRHFDHENLAQWLETDAATLNRLAVCRRPVSTMTGYRAAVEGLATHFGLPALKLAMLLRRAETLFGATTTAPDAGLMAARDHAEDEDDG